MKLVTMFHDTRCLYYCICIMHMYYRKNYVAYIFEYLRCAVTATLLARSMIIISFFLKVILQHKVRLTGPCVTRTALSLGRVCHQNDKVHIGIYFHWKFTDFTQKWLSSHTLLFSSKIIFSHVFIKWKSCSFVCKELKKVTKLHLCLKL